MTGSELNLIGFRVHRHTAKGEWRALGADTIPAKHMGEISGDTYKFADRQVKAQHTYRYKLQVLYADGHTEWTKPVRVKLP